MMSPWKPKKTNIKPVPACMIQADPNSCPDPITFYHEHALDQICASPSRQTRRAIARGDKEKHTEKSLKLFATGAIEFEEVSKYLQDGSGTSIQAGNRPSAPLISSIS